MSVPLKHGPTSSPDNDESCVAALKHIHCVSEENVLSHGSTTRFLRNGEKYYVHFIDSLSVFAIVKEFSKSVNSW